MDTITQTITEYASTSAFEHLTEEAVHAAKQRLIDSLGCAVGAHDCEPAQIGRRLARGQTPGKYPGRVLYFGDRLPVESAAFINTSMIRNFDFNDRYPGGHPSDCLGALLALAGATDIDGKRLLASMVVAYEIFARLSDATALSRRGWDQGYAVGIATAAGTCNLLKVAPAATAHAVGIAAASNLPLRVTRSGELTPVEERGHGLCDAQRRVCRIARRRRNERTGQRVRGPQWSLRKSNRTVRARAVTKLRRRRFDTQSSIEILAHRNQWPARGLGGPGAA